MNYESDDFLMHEGVIRRSGRYPWGSGKNPYQHSGDFLSRLKELEDQGLSEPEIAKALGFVDEQGNSQTSKLRTQASLAKAERRALLYDTANSLREKGYTPTEIARQMGYKNESSVRSLLNKSSAERMTAAQKTADFLKEQVDKKGMIDIGKGVELSLGVSPEKLKQAVYILEREGYVQYGGGIPNATNPGKQLNRMVLCKPGTEHKEIFNYENVHTIDDYTSRDGGETFDKLEYPASMDSKRISIRYAEEGGLAKDGLVEIRRGVKDLSLGNSRYAQVRILVDDTKYIKGMAVYSDDMPEGTDIIFNTNKKVGTPKMDVLKNIKDDPDNPFGSLIKANGQSYYIDDDGTRKLSVINKRAEEGDWEEWSNKLPSQFLAKQSKKLIDRQLNLAIADKQDEFDEIASLTNPTIKKNLLRSFADDCDSAAVHLQAAALPRQKYKVIVPISSIKDNEVYAPSFEDGEKVALVRYPHGGTFEIPILKVNNKQKEAIDILGTTPTDAIGINSNVAARLSGADFDGDTVMVIPTGGKIKIESTNPLKGLEGFDTKIEYGGVEAKDSNGKTHYYRNGIEYPIMKNTGNEMGKISNLITDMTLKGAHEEELARAVRHSMVVIDAEKHKLDYKQSFKDNRIDELKRKYQGSIDEKGKYHEGASTLLSRSKSEVSIPKTKGSPKINQKGKEWYDPNKPEGSLIYKYVDEQYKVYKYIKDPETGNKKIDPLTGKPIKIDTGKTKSRTQKSTKMAETPDAYSLISDADTPVERAYADYANTMKRMANEARMMVVNTGKIAYSKTANKEYKDEVESLTAKLRVSLMNAPKERQANAIANTIVEAKKRANPDMTSGEIKKINQQELAKARILVGAQREKINIEDREWEAIQAGAISENTLSKIILNTDPDKLKERATPKTRTTLSEAKINHLRTLKESGYTIKQIAEKLSINVSAVSNYLKGDNTNGQ